MYGNISERAFQTAQDVFVREDKPSRVVTNFQALPTFANYRTAMDRLHSESVRAAEAVPSLDIPNPSPVRLSSPTISLTEVEPPIEDTWRDLDKIVLDHSVTSTTKRIPTLVEYVLYDPEPLPDIIFDGTEWVFSDTSVTDDAIDSSGIRTISPEVRDCLSNVVPLASGRRNG
ncbi:MAG: hypothetical protein IPJ69_14720 [Deltaproteobacteria bacterium]|nr:MAG: hypothetical protein IPJ69_14720 [Deltaproteobacteria bacterium]